MCSRSSSVRDLQTSKGKMRVIRISSFRHQESTFIPRKVNKQIFSYPPPPPLPFVVRHYYLCTHIRGLYSPPPPSSSFSTYPRTKPFSALLSHNPIGKDGGRRRKRRRRGGIHSPPFPFVDRTSYSTRKGLLGARRGRGGIRRQTLGVKV